MLNPVYDQALNIRRSCRRGLGLTLRSENLVALVLNEALIAEVVIQEDGSRGAESKRACNRKGLGESVRLVSGADIHDQRGIGRAPGAVDCEVLVVIVSTRAEKAADHLDATHCHVRPERGDGSCGRSASDEQSCRTAGSKGSSEPEDAGI